MKNPQQSCKKQENDNGSISYRTFRNILIALALCLSYLMGKFFREQNAAIPNRTRIHYTVNK